MELLDFEALFNKLRTGDETVAIEAKRSEEFGKSAFETVSAFSNEPNQGGGYFVLGVAPIAGKLFPDYEIVGVPHPDRLQSDIATVCREAFSSVIRPAISVENVSGKTVIVVHVPEAKAYEKPVYIKSKGPTFGSFRRIGPTDQLCTDDDLALFYQLREHKTYDETVIDGTDLDDFDPVMLESLSGYVKR